MLHPPLVMSLGILALDLKPGTMYGPKFYCKYYCIVAALMKGGHFQSNPIATVGNVIEVHFLNNLK